MVSVPVRSLLTKKTAPPPSRAWLPVMVPRSTMREVVAVGVDRSSGATARRAGPGRVRAPAHRAVVGEHAVEDPQETPMLSARPRWSNAATGARERAVDDPHRPAVVLLERPDGAAAEVGPGPVAPVAVEREPTMSRPPRTKTAPPPPPSACRRWHRHRQGEVLDHQPGVPGPGSATSSRPASGRRCSGRGCVPAAPAQGHQAAAVDDHPGAGVDHLGGRLISITGSGPQWNLITPPFATARTTAFDVQLAGVPSPTQVTSAWRGAATGAGVASTSAARGPRRSDAICTGDGTEPGCPRRLRCWT